MLNIEQVSNFPPFHAAKALENMYKSTEYILSDLRTFLIKDSHGKCKTSRQKTTNHVMKDSGKRK